MITGFRRKKIILLAVLGTLLIADASTVIFSVRAISSNDTPQQQLAAQLMMIRLLKADVKRAHEIQLAVPKTKADCGVFENSLLSEDRGYSTVSAELQDLSQKSGLKIDALSFHPKDGALHGISEVLLDASITGDYTSVFRFLSELQHSKNHYVVNDLTLANARTGIGSLTDVRVNLHIKSYFRAAS
jgi:type IV pilus assembly protein PilO